MLNCEQTKGQTVFSHCHSVAEYIEELMDYIKDLYSLRRKWKLPEWIDDYKEEINDNINGRIYEYARYHDCGKPFCRIIGEDGKVHFPDHAAVSSRVYLYLGGHEKIANLIGWDMVIHMANAAEIQNYCEEKWSAQDAVTLLIAAIAEIHSNARMFGGVDSQNFKIKWKQINKRGKQILKHFFPKGDQK